MASCVEDKESVLSQAFICQPIVLDAAFDRDTRRFEIFARGGYISQGFWEQYRRENPDSFAQILKQKRAPDPSEPGDIFIEIGNCSPS